MDILNGCATAMVTPFRQGQIDYEGLQNLIENQIRHQVSIVVCGTTAETATLSPEEYEQIIRFTVDIVGKRVPVVAGCGSNSTDKTIANARLCESLGVDGLLIVTPYYNKTTQRGLIAHYTAIAEETCLPILLYNVPGRTGLNMQAETVATLSRVKNIIGLKEAGDSIHQVAETIRLAEENFVVYSGNDDMTVPMMSLGGQGVISVISNILPEDTRRMVDLFRQGDCTEAGRAQVRMNDLVAKLFIETNPIPVKQAMAEMGICSNEVRLPLVNMEEKTRNQLRNAMLDYGISLDQSHKEQEQAEVRNQEIA